MKDDEIELEKRLKRMSGQGVNLYLEGKPSSPENRNRWELREKSSPPSQTNSPENDSTH